LLHDISQAFKGNISLEKAVNHGAHGEHGVKTKDYTLLGIHPLGESSKGPKLPFSVASTQIRRSGFSPTYKLLISFMSNL
jgi:hypothetical protein